MVHVRKQIRDDVVTTLTGLTTTGTRVFASRVYPNEAGKLPLLCVYSLNEASELIAMNGNQLLRSLEIVVEGYAKAKANLDDTLDTIAKEVEEALAVDPTRGSIAHKTVINDTEISLSEEGEQPIGVIRMSFQVDYVTTSGDVENNV
jgi:hypothetical protein